MNHFYAYARSANLGFLFGYALRLAHKISPAFDTGYICIRILCAVGLVSFHFSDYHVRVIYAFLGNDEEEVIKG